MVSRKESRHIVSVLTAPQRLNQGVLKGAFPSSHPPINSRPPSSPPKGSPPFFLLTNHLGFAGSRKQRKNQSKEISGSAQQGLSHCWIGRLEQRDIKLRGERRKRTKSIEGRIDSKRFRMYLSHVSNRGQTQELTKQRDEIQSGKINRERDVGVVTSRQVYILG